jgi:hypothetical protein
MLGLSCFASLGESTSPMESLVLGDASAWRTNVWYSGSAMVGVHNRESSCAGLAGDTFAHYLRQKPDVATLLVQLQPARGSRTPGQVRAPTQNASSSRRRPVRARSPSAAVGERLDDEWAGVRAESTESRRRANGAVLADEADGRAPCDRLREACKNRPCECVGSRWGLHAVRRMARGPPRPRWNARSEPRAGGADASLPPSTHAGAPIARAPAAAFSESGRRACPRRRARRAPDPGRSPGCIRLPAPGGARFWPATASQDSPCGPRPADHDHSDAHRMPAASLVLDRFSVANGKHAPSSRRRAGRGSTLMRAPRIDGPSRPPSSGSRPRPITHRTRPILSRRRRSCRHPGWASARARAAPSRPFPRAGAEAGAAGDTSDAAARAQWPETRVCVIVVARGRACARAEAHPP